MYADLNAILAAEAQRQRAEERERNAAHMAAHVMVEEVAFEHELLPLLPAGFNVLWAEEEPPQVWE